MNKKYHVLDNIDLAEALKTKTMKELSVELGVPAGSIRWKRDRELTEEQKAECKQGKKYHTNKKRTMARI